MNVWIDLAEGKTEQSSRLRGKLQCLVKRGKMFCPLVPTIIWELFRQSYASAIEVAALMEELSLGVSFAPTEEIYTHEVDAAFEAISGGAEAVVGPANLYVPIMAYISSSARMIFPNAALFENPEDLTAELGQRLRAMGLVDLCNLMKSTFPHPEIPAPEFAVAGLRRREIAGRSRKKIRRIEELAVLRSTVTPRLIELRRRLSPVLQLVFHARLLKLSKHEPDGVNQRLMSLMPSIRHRIEVFSIVGQDPGRRDRISDFFDLELIMAPYVYSTALVTRDKWIRYILKGLGGEHRGLWTHNALERFLDGLADL